MTVLLTAPEVAERLRCSDWTIKELVRQGKVSCVRLGTTASDRGQIAFTPAQVEEIVNHLTVQAVAPATPRRRKRRTA